MIPLLSAEKTRIRVSSVLNRDTTTFGKQHLLDGDSNTCWNSEQGTPQFIVLELERPAHIATISIQFQGGFVGFPMHVQGMVDGAYTDLTIVHPEDINAVQTWQMPEGDAIQRVRITFPESTDFYGRVTIYQLEAHGKWSVAEES